MWSKLSNALKSQSRVDLSAEPQELPEGEVMTKVFEQHPNLSIFHNTPEHPFPSDSPSTSPSKTRNMFKRLSRQSHPNPEDLSRTRSPSPTKLNMGISKKFKSTLTLKSTSIGRAAGQGSLPVDESPRPSTESTQSRDTLRRASFDMLRCLPEEDTPHPQDSSPTRPSTSREHQHIDLMNQTPPDNTGPYSTPFDSTRHGSVRSILRHPKTPGTGQNVRFFSRDAYKVMTPDISAVAIQQEGDKSVEPEGGDFSFISKLQRATGMSLNTSGSKSGSSAGRPSVAEIFGVDATNEHSFPPFDSGPISPPNVSNIFNMEHELPPIPMSRFSVGMLDVPIVITDNDGELSLAAPPQDGLMASTPLKPSHVEGDMFSTPASSSMSMSMSIDKPLPEPQPSPSFFDKPLPSTQLHDRSQSFSFGQTVFHSMANDNTTSREFKTTSLPSDLELHAQNTSRPSFLNKLTLSRSESDTRPSSAMSGSFSKHRKRSQSDTVFQSMMRASGSKSAPEADINDESSSSLVVSLVSVNEEDSISRTRTPEPTANNSVPNASAYILTPESDPFRANGTGFYTPGSPSQIAPRSGSVVRVQPKHDRKASKEEDMIFTLRTQLALQTELCTQYEIDLRARDEMVEVLNKRLETVETDADKKKGVLRSWKKKVQELEKACRYLEQEVDGGKQMSMERSIMDEASSEALRMLHRRIEGLEREKRECEKREEGLTVEVEELKASMAGKEESEQELKDGILKVQAEMEVMGSRLSVAEVLKSDEPWEEEKVNLIQKTTHLQQAFFELQAQLDNTREKLRVKEDEFAMLKTELEAQWSHTEVSSEKIAALEKEKDEVIRERDTLQGELQEVEQRVNGLEVDWAESENRKVELEEEVQELWMEKEDLSRAREQFEAQLQEEQYQYEALAATLQEREDRIATLERDHQFAQDRVTRLEENVRQRDTEIEQYSQRMITKGIEVEELCEEMSTLKREQARIVDEQSRALRETSSQEGVVRRQMEALVREKAERDVELSMSRDSGAAFKQEVERLRRQVHELQQESADKEVKLVQVTKQRAQDKEDLQGLNIALDSKQQELELLKRKMGVKGTAGSTPARPTGHARRSSTSTFSTPIAPRPSSVISDSGSVKDEIQPSMLLALGRSARTNLPRASTPSSASTALGKKPSRGIEGSMGPPPAVKPRASINGTPTPTQKVGLSKSSSVSSIPSRASQLSPVSRRKASVGSFVEQTKLKLSKQGVAAGPLSEEKENSMDVSFKSSQSRTVLATPA